MNGIRIRLLFVTILMEALLVGCFTSNNESLINNSVEQVFNLEKIDPVYICNQPPAHFNLQDILGIQSLSHLSFIGEEVIFLQGWGEVPLLDLRETNNPFRRILKNGQIYLATQEAILLQTNSIALLSNPCTDECPFQILDHSPMNQWQIIQIEDTLEEFGEIWLVSQNDQVKLIDYIPFGSTWQWSTDGSLLWFTYSERVYGLHTNIIHLTSPPIIIDLDSRSFLQPTYYHTAFSPDEKTVLSIAKPMVNTQSTQGQLYRFDLAHDHTRPYAVESFPKLVKVEWNVATNNYLLITVQEDIIQIVDRGTARSVQLPFSAFENLLSSAALSANFPFSYYALSSSLQHLAIATGGGDIFVFACNG